MVSKNQIKLITALRQKKFRHSDGLFFAEGLKVISELLDSHFVPEQIYATASVSDNFPAEITTLISEVELSKISALTTPNACLGVFRIPVQKPLPTSGLIVALDDVRDPGNLGTIVRLCDWFGVAHLVCSDESADVFNPKVVQAAMGSIARVEVSYTNLEAFVKGARLPVFGTFMDGNNIYDESLPLEGIIVLGNEANGISEEVEALSTNRISIPRFGKLQRTESLNVATAAAIVLSEFRRGS
ncbi:MAG TPA: RNA methyltransferase [Flavobacterium sp.]|jgi:TrmH family RNA methyltransferase